ncbi:MAG: hypothetical protein KC486_36470 [Myxococcales bacterium]|nr:hypothetical protein [Myxococcales bacterium]
MRTSFSLSGISSALLLAGVLGGCIVVSGGTASDSDTSSSSGDSDSDTSTSTSTTQGSVTVTDGMTSSTTNTTVSTTEATEGTESSTSSSTGETTAETTGGEPTCENGCGDADYCDWKANSCGESRSDKGTCELAPDGCDDVYMPVCGCDGQVHGNECEAHGAGTDVAAAGGCEAPEGYFPCGYMYCDVATSYCQVSLNDVVGEPDYYQCNPLPEACGKEQVCDCLAEEPCFEFECSDDGNGGLTTTCPGG